MMAAEAQVEASESNDSKKPRTGMLGIGQLPEAAESLIMDFVGQGEWFYLAQVCKLWRQEVLQRFSSRQQTASLRRGNRGRRYAPRTACFTKYSAVLASVTRLQLAIECGFNLYLASDTRYNSWRVAHAAGRYADKEVLLWLKAHHNTLWGESVCGGAIAGRRLAMLQWLHDEQQCPWSVIAGREAACTNQLDMLKYIYRKRDGGCHGQHAALVERYDFSMNAVQSDNPTLLSWCEKKRLLCNGHGDDVWGLYHQSIVSNCTRVRSWLYRHGYRLPADDENYAAMVARHAGEDQTAENHEDCDLTSYSESGSLSSDCDADSTDTLSAVQQDTAASGDESTS
jgi:hypothetical protein